MKKCTVIGIHKIEKASGKDEGKVLYHYYFTEPFSNYDLDNSDCSGLKTFKEFSYVDFGVKVGDVVVPYYERMVFGKEERAVLTDLIPVKA